MTAHDLGCAPNDCAPCCGVYAARLIQQTREAIAIVEATPGMIEAARRAIAAAEAPDLTVIMAAYPAAPGSAG